MSAHRDPELDQLGDERGWTQDDRELAHLLRASTHPYAQVEPTPQFRQALQRRLMREAWEQASRPAQPWYRRMLAPQPMAWAGAAVGAVMIVFVAFFFLATPHQTDRIDVHVDSPLQNAQLVPTATAIELKFSQPMDTKTVDVDVQPAIEYKKVWQGNTLKITPRNGLTPNTQYKVDVKSAQTATHQPVAKIQPVTFSTAPAPTPTPSAGPTPTPSPSPVQNAHQVAPIGTPRARWSADGNSLVVIGPTGQLQVFPIAGGAAQKLADGATLAAIAPDGSSAWVSGGQVTWKSAAVSGAQAIALGFRSGGVLLVATASDVETTDQRRLAVFREAADAVDFSPAGDRVVYHGAQGIHVVDLASARDTQVGPGVALGAWAPDGRHYAYVTDGGVAVADTAAGTTAKLLDLPGVTGLSWSGGNQLLLATATSLYLATYSDSSAVAAHKVQDGVFSQPDWAPAGATGLFSFRRGGDVWVGRVQGAIAGGPITAATPDISQDELVNAFMAARKNQLADQAQAFLDAAGQSAFARLNLVYTDPSTSLARYYVLLSQPGRVVVRLVLAHGLTQTAVDETLVIQPDAAGRSRIHAVSEVPRSQFGSGPEVVQVVVNSSQVQVTFDSDLDPTSAGQPGAVSLRGVSAASRFDSRTKTITLTVPGGLTPGASYDLLIDPSLQDVNQRHANTYDLPFTGPAGA